MAQKNRKTFAPIDLGPGDGGKGGIVHALALRVAAHTIVKVGGLQGSHGVRNSRGESFEFSQLGCGTLEGIPTFVSANFVLGPYQLLAELDEIRRRCGIDDAASRLAIDGRAICSTPAHLCVSQLRELARGADARGTVGTGAGEAAADARDHPDLVIRAEDLGKPYLRDKLEALRRAKLEELAPIIEGEFLEADRELAGQRIHDLRSESLTSWTVEKFSELAGMSLVVPGDYLASEVLDRDGNVVVESSHGVLTDRHYGFHPHVSKLSTMPSRTDDMLRAAGYEGEVRHLGLFRAYGIRHGAGPFVTNDPEMPRRLLPRSCKHSDRFKGDVRMGPIDLVSLRYAIEACGGPSAFFGLAVTWFDQIVANREWRFCDSYNLPDVPDIGEFFASTGEIVVRRGDDEAHLARQQRLGQILNECSPNVSTHHLEFDSSREGLARGCADFIGDKLGVPVRMVSVGPTEDDKEFF